MAEAVGFWILFVGYLLWIWSSLMVMSDTFSRWFQRLPLCVLLVMPMNAVIMMLIGWHMWSFANQGRYPGYPFE